MVCYLSHLHMGVSKNCGTPKWVVLMENPLKMDDLGYHYFWKHPYHCLPNNRNASVPSRLCCFCGVFYCVLLHLLKVLKRFAKQPSAVNAVSLPSSPSFSCHLPQPLHQQRLSFCKCNLQVNTHFPTYPVALKTRP